MPDQLTQPFDAHAWARSSLHDAPKLHSDTLLTVAGFTFVWNLFEGIACNSHVTVPELDRVATRLTHLLKITDIKQSLSFYRFRYVKDGELQDLFYGLNFRQPDKQELVASVLKDKGTSHHENIMALLIIAYRIRNNIFHGLKSVHIWDDQAQNISEASRILSIAFEALCPHIAKRACVT